MDESDSTTRHQVDEFNRTLQAVTTFYQKQAYLAGLKQAKQVWDAMNAPPMPAQPVTRRTRRLVLATAITAVAATVGSVLYLFQTHLAPPPAALPPLHSLSYWLNLVK